MAGIKGMKGGGGARPGAGRKPKKESEKRTKPVCISERDMLTLLQDIALGRTEATALQVRAAIAAVQYTHVKAGDGGKKDEQKEAAKKASAGRFAPAVPPRLVIDNER